MDFYTSIADIYDSIFPLNREQISFIKSSLGQTELSSLLDIGCGTGNLSIALATFSNTVMAIDLDESMLKKAREKSAGQTNLHLSRLDMLDIASTYPKGSFDAIICFGNTLVHLGSNIEILDFFQQAQSLLKPGGKLLVQIINYDRIIDFDIDHLPTIENDKVKFERKYIYHPVGNKLDFDTILTIKETGQEIKNCVQLLPIRKSEVKNLLHEAGFSNIKFYGNFKRDELTKESIPLVFEADTKA